MRLTIRLQGLPHHWGRNILLLRFLRQSTHQSRKVRCRLTVLSVLRTLQSRFRYFVVASCLCLLGLWLLRNDVYIRSLILQGINGGHS